jgi:hypothetical protein
MTTKISSILAILFLAGSAWASKPVVFECPYELHSTINGKPISSGVANVLLNKPTNVEINNSASTLKKFNALVEEKFVRTHPDGGVDWLSLKASAPSTIKIFFNTDESGKLTFGDATVFGSMTVGKPQTFYYQLKNEIITLSAKDAIETQGSCVGGNLQDAVKNLTSSVGHNAGIHITENTIEWTQTTHRCLEESNEINEHGGRECLVWADPVVTDMALPVCSE